MPELILEAQALLTLGDKSGLRQWYADLTPAEQALVVEWGNAFAATAIVAGLVPPLIAMTQAVEAFVLSLAPLIEWINTVATDPTFIAMVEAENRRDALAASFPDCPVELYAYNDEHARSHGDAPPWTCLN